MEAPKLEGTAALGYDTGAFQGGFPQGELVPTRCQGRVELVRWGNSYSLTSPFSPLWKVRGLPPHVLSVVTLPTPPVPKGKLRQ